MAFMKQCLDKHFNAPIKIIDIMTEAEQAEYFHQDGCQPGRWFWVSTPYSEKTFVDIKRLL